MEFDYNWKLSNLKKVKKQNLKVFSCFSGGGGSTMGYKMNGLDVVGFCEIDNKMSDNYLLNFNPFYKYKCDIRNLNISKLKIDILDGSPPCSTFSLSGKRENDWGKKRKFSEGQKKQVLDTLFFDFIEIIKQTSPKIVIAENVKGIMLGNAKKYSYKIKRKIERLGYKVFIYLLNGKYMGLPQQRERIFFICIKNFNKELKLKFNEKPILLKNLKVKSFTGRKLNENRKLFQIAQVAKCGNDLNILNQGRYFNYRIVDPNKVFYTLTSEGYCKNIHWNKKNFFSEEVLYKVSSWPVDYKFTNNNIGLKSYIMGMSVPPLMIYKLINKLLNQIY